MLNIPNKNVVAASVNKKTTLKLVLTFLIGEYLCFEYNLSRKMPGTLPRFNLFAIKRKLLQLEVFEKRFFVLQVFLYSYLYDHSLSNLHS